MNAAWRPDRFDQALARLVEWMRAAADASQTASPTPMRNELLEVARQLDTVANRVESGPAWSELEDAYPSIKGMIGRMRDLAAAAVDTADALRDPRARPWLQHAALLYLHVRYSFGQGRPSHSPKGAEELGRLLSLAGSPRSPDRVLSLLKAAMADFDPHIPTPGLGDLLAR